MMALLRRDDGALEALPLRLMIVAVVAAMSVIPAAEALETMKDREFMIRAELLLDQIISSAQRVAMQGPGSVATIELDFRSEGRTDLESLMIGDSIGGPYQSSVILELASGAKVVRTCDVLGARIVSTHNDTLIIHSELATVRMAGQLMDGIQCVAVDVV